MTHFWNLIMACSCCTAGLCLLTQWLTILSYQVHSAGSLTMSHLVAPHSDAHDICSVMHAATDDSARNAAKFGNWTLSYCRLMIRSSWTGNSAPQSSVVKAPFSKICIASKRSFQGQRRMLLSYQKCVAPGHMSHVKLITAHNVQTNHKHLCCCC